MDRAERLIGCLIGTAVGDSLLLPAEGLSRKAIARRFTGRPRHRLIFGRGMISDDTEHAFLTAQALLVADGDPQRSARPCPSVCLSLATLRAAGRSLADGATRPVRW